MRLHVEEAKLEHGEQSARARANNQHIGFDRFAHIRFFSVGIGEDGFRPRLVDAGSGHA